MFWAPYYWWNFQSSSCTVTTEPCMFCKNSQINLLSPKLMSQPVVTDSWGEICMETHTHAYWTLVSQHGTVWSGETTPCHVRCHHTWFGLLLGNTRACAECVVSRDNTRSRVLLSHVVWVFARCTRPGPSFADNFHLSYASCPPLSNLDLLVGGFGSIPDPIQLTCGVSVGVITLFFLENF